MPEYNAIKEIKEDINKDIDAIHDGHLYTDICRLLEIALKDLIKTEDLYINTNSLSEMTNKVAQLIRYNNIDKINHIISLRNSYIHNPEGIKVTINFSETISKVYDYNNFIDKIATKYKKFSLIYKIDTSVFDVDFTTLAASEKVQTSYDLYMAKLDIAEKRKKLGTLKPDTPEYVEQTIHIYNLEKNLLPMEIKRKTFNLKKVNNENSEFDYCVGANESDSGFIIHGIASDKVCKNKYASLFAVIHNILQKGSIYTPSSYILQHKDIGTNMKYIIRYQMIILSMIKNNIANYRFNVKIDDGTEKEFVLALKDIVEYLNILCKLQNIESPKIVHKFDDKGIKLSVKDNNADIYTEDKTIEREGSYYLWTERLIKYRIDENNSYLLDILCQNIFGFKSLKNGQKKAIISILNAPDENFMGLMPTGYGKSLVFYFVSLMTPGFSLIVYPTEALIEDQRRNLQVFHKIDNVARLPFCYSYTDYPVSNKMVLADAQIFLNDTFVKRMSEYANDGVLNFVIMDEVHCLSLLGHDFRTDYIMMVLYLGKYLPSARLLGFTATANHGVLMDIKSRLKISDKNIIQTDNLKRSNIYVSNISVDSSEEVLEKVNDRIKKAAKTHCRTLIFVKTKQAQDDIRAFIKRERLGNVDICIDSTEQVYIDFVEKKTDVLVTSNEMGIGINLPEINKCIHMGYPVSVNQFIQEAGRVAREENLKGEAVTITQSLVSLSEEENELLDLNMPIDEILERVKPERFGKSDIVDIFKGLFGYLESPSKTISRLNTLVDIIKKIHKRDDLYFYPVRSDKTVKMIGLYFVMLLNLGYISEWFYVGRDKDISKYKVTLSDNKTLSQLKKSAIKSLTEMNASSYDIFRIKDAETEYDLILRYVRWYYDKFLNNQREEIINAVTAVSNGDLYEFFELDFAEVESIRKDINALSTKQIISGDVLWLSKPTQTNIIAAVYKLIEMEQNVKYDLVILWFTADKHRKDFASRVHRVFTALEYSYVKDHFTEFCPLYCKCSDENKSILLNEILKCVDDEMVLRQFFKAIDKTNDYNFYGLFTKVFNKYMES